MPFVFVAILATRSDAHAEDASPVFGVTIPEGYRQWHLISPSQPGEPFDELRAILGNDAAIKSYGAKKHAAAGSWGFAKFIGGKPVDEAEHRACFACHEAHVKARDFVFTRFAP